MSGKVDEEAEGKLNEMNASADQKHNVRTMISEPGSLVDKFIEHAWFENGDVVYHGHISVFKPRKVPKQRKKLKVPAKSKPAHFTVGYWSESESEAESSDEDIPISTFS